MRLTWLYLLSHVLMGGHWWPSVCQVWFINQSTGSQGTEVYHKYKYIFDPLTIIRYPQPVSPWLNLVNLLTPTSWAWTLASLATVALCFNVASLVVRRWMGMRLENIEIDLWPFR